MKLGLERVLVFHFKPLPILFLILGLGRSSLENLNLTENKNSVNKTGANHSAPPPKRKGLPMRFIRYKLRDMVNTQLVF